jgi:hypothetical protein
MAQPCTLCYYRDQVAVRQAFNDGLSDRAIGRLFGLSHVQVGYHRKRHVFEPLAAAVELPDRDTIQQQRPEEQLASIEAADLVSVADTRTAFSWEAQLEKVATEEAELVRLGGAARRAGLIGVAIQAADKRLKAIEIGSKLAQVGGYGALGVAGQTGERRPVFSIQMVFTNSGRTEEIHVMEHPRPIEQEADAEAGATTHDSSDVD